MHETAAPADEIVFPASMDQEAFFYLEKLVKSVAPFNVAVRFRLDGPLGQKLLKQAFDRIAERHEVLRTHFEDGDESLLQVVDPKADVPVEFVDLTDRPEEERTEELERLGMEDARQVFDLGVGPLIRALVVRTSEETHILHVSVHHAVADGWSIGILAQELTEIYGALAEGREPDLPELAIQYGDFAVWQQEFLEGPEVLREVDYWKNRLAGMTEVDLPTDRLRPPVKNWNGNIVSEVIPVELAARLQVLASERGATLFHVFLAAFKVLLHRLSGSEDIAVGSPISGRTTAQIEPLIGTFINTVVLRTDLGGNPTFATVLDRVRETTVEALAHPNLPFEALVRELQPARDASRNPLVQINFTHQRDFVRPANMGPVRLTALPSWSPGAIFDLHFFMVERDGEWRVSCDYYTDLFDEATARRWLRNFQKLLESISSDVTARIGDLTLMGEADLTELTVWRGREIDYPSKSTLGELFAATAREFADRTALLHADARMSYRELHGEASRVALDLQRSGVGPGTLVGLAVPTSPTMVVALLGITLAGGAYVPIDTNYPEARVRLLIENADLQFVVTDRVTAASLPLGSHTVLLVELSEEAPEPVQIEGTANSADDPAYLLYTSGSTGEPKGVLVPNRAVVRLVRGQNYASFGPDEVFLLAAPMSFDASTFELWGPLLNGGTLSFPKPGCFGLAGLARSVRENGVTVLWLTAGLFQVMVEEYLEDLVGLRYLLAGGDVLPVAQVKDALKGLPNTRLVNGYGPTENTTFTACHEIAPSDLNLPSIPVGAPIANTTVWILDPHGRQVPVGVPGELYTGGDGLALGYWRDTKLTNEKFVKNPCPFGGGERLYRTGDRVRWRPDGTIEFLGRMDRQVKIRGCRVEPGEVEAVLAAHPDVAQGKVAVSGGTAETKKLVCWASPLSGRKLERRDLAGYFAGKLPPFLCPDLIVLMDELPLTKNGKIDVDALPDPELSIGESIVAAEPPATKTEKMLAATCCQLLGIATMGRDDNIFDLGGHSLMVMRLFAAIRRAYGVTLPLASVLRAPTVRALGDLLDEERLADDSIIIDVQPHGELPPLFCVHGGGGGVMYSRHLAPHFGQDRPLLAIEAPALAGNDEIRYESVPDIAASYLAIVRARQPRGPYLLCGYSFGGLVAYEMAVQLDRGGDQVQFLGLFDAVHPAAKSRPYTISERIARAWRTEMATSGWKAPWKFLHRVGWRLAERRGWVSGPPSTRGESPPDQRGLQLFDQHRTAAKNYEPLPYPGRLTVFRSAIGDALQWVPQDYGWRDVASEVRIIEIAGRHLELFDDDHVPIFARKLLAEIADSKATVSR